MRHAGGVLSASALNSGVALAITLATAALLPLAEFGALGLCLALVTLLAALGDAGTSLALVRHAAREPAQARAAAFAVLGWKILFAAALLAMGTLAPDDVVARWLPPLAGQRALLVATCLGAGLLGLWGTARALDQSREDFAALDRWLLACAVLRATAFVALLLTGALAPLSVLASLYVVPLAALLVLRARPARAPAPELRQAAAAIARYGAWVGASAACFIAFTRAPMLVAGHAAGADVLGVLGGAMTLALACALLGEALRTVALPRILRATSAAARREVRAWLARAARPLLAAAAAATLLAAAAYDSILGPAHAAGAVPFAMVALATLLAADLGLHNALLHAQGRPQLDLAVNVVRLLAMGLLAAVVPPTPLAIAAAYAAVLVGGEVLLYGAVRRLDRFPVASLQPEPTP